MTLEVKPTDTLFHTSPDVGMKDCICSRCLQQITEEDGPAIRVWPEDEKGKMTGEEYRYHIKCCQTPLQKEYTVKCKFSTCKASRGGSLYGSSGRGEVDITVDGPFDKTNTTDPELIKSCVQMLQANPKIKGVIIDLQIIEIVEK